MKKEAIFRNVAMCALLAMAMHAVAQTDTITNRCPYYYYTNAEWYDSSWCFLNGRRAQLMPCHTSFGQAFRVLANYHFASSPLVVYGVAAMVEDFYVPSVNAALFRGPEYFVLYKYDPVDDTLLFLDSVRWDTATPKIYRLKAGVQDTASYLYARVYEARFLKPLIVDSAFYVGGTFNNNTGDVIDPGVTHYLTVESPWCQAAHPFLLYLDGRGWLELRRNSSEFTTFFPIAEDTAEAYRTVAVLSADTTAGTVTGGGSYLAGSLVTISALPDSMHLFEKWNDDNLSNPRRIYVTTDTTFVAYFRAKRNCHVSAVVTDTTLGEVQGGGMYLEQSEVTLTAVPHEGCRFVTWTDGIRDNPRVITVTNDTTLFAIMQREVGVEVIEGQDAPVQVRPNPTHGMATLESASPMEWAELYDDAGRLLWRKEMGGSLLQELNLSALAPGVYLLHVRTVQGDTTIKVAVR